MKKNDFIVIQSFMVTDLQLSGNRLIIYALIHGFCKDGEHEFMGSINYICEWTNLTRNTVIATLKSLVDDGLIVKKEFTTNNVRFCSYTLGGSAKIAPVVQNTNDGSAKIDVGGSAKIAPNNIIYNNINNNNINIKEKEDKSSLKKCSKIFTPPTIQEVEAFIKEKGYNFSARSFIDYYEADDWHYGTGANRKKVSNWKRCCITWGEKRTNNNDLFAQTFDNNNEDNAMQKFLALSDSEQASVLRLDAYQYHMLSSKGKSEWIKNRKQFILQWATSNG